MKKTATIVGSIWETVDELYPFLKDPLVTMDERSEDTLPIPTRFTILHVNIEDASKWGSSFKFLTPLGTFWGFTAWLLDKTNCVERIV